MFAVWSIDLAQRISNSMVNGGIPQCIEFNSVQSDDTKDYKYQALKLFACLYLEGEGRNVSPLLRETFK